MSEVYDYLAKAQENLASAENDVVHGRYNSCTRSAYYACFHAAITALIHAEVVASMPDRLWGHDRVQAHFVAQLIQRRRYYPASLRRTLTDLLAMRHKADYRVASVSQREAQECVRRARTFVRTITAHVTPERDA